MKLENQIENYLKAEPTKRYSTEDITVRFGRNREVTAVLQKIRAGYMPYLYFSKERTPKGTGLRFEYYYIPEGFEPLPKILTFRELIEKGYLQEANRLFFNTLGLSLAIASEDAPSLIVYDFRDSLHGVMFSPEVTCNPKFKERVEYVAFERETKRLVRQTLSKFSIGDGSKRSHKQKQSR
jgi:hypothetical protein